MMKTKFVRLLVCLIAFAGIALGGEKPWIEVKSPHFRVLTDGGPGEARLVAREFEDFRALMTVRYPGFKLESGAPLTIFAAKDEETAKSLNPGIWKMKGEKPAGLYRRSWEKQFAMVRLDGWGRGAQPGVFYEYAALVLSLNSRWTPIWLNVGFNEFYSYTTFAEDKAYIGAPSMRLKLLKSMHIAPIPVETLIEVNGRSSYMHDSEDIQRFYAESWLLFHYLMMSPEMGGGAKLQQFFDMLQSGAKQKEAFQQVFGSFKAMDAALQKYLDRNNLPAAQVNNPVRYNDKDFSVRTMTMAETQAELGGYHLWLRDWDNARDYVKDALSNDSNLGLAHEEQGFLYLHDGKDAAAVPEFAAAVEKDKTLFLSQFFKTMIRREGGSIGFPARADRHLESEHAVCAGVSAAFLASFAAERFEDSAELCDARGGAGTLSHGISYLFGRVAVADGPLPRGRGPCAVRGGSVDRRGSQRSVRIVEQHSGSESSGW